MNKLISKIVGVCLGLSLATGVGVGVAVGQDAIEAKAESTTATWTATNGGIEGKTSSTITDDDGNTWDVSRDSVQSTGWNGTAGAIQLGKNGGAETVVFSTSDISGTITNVDVTCASYQSKHTIDIEVGGTSYHSAATPAWGSGSVSKVASSGSSSGEITITFTPGANARAMYIAKIEVTYQEGEVVTVTSLDTEPEDGEMVNLNANGAYSVNSLLLYEVTYSDSSTDYEATISGSPTSGFSHVEDGEGNSTLTFTANGTYTITVTADENHSSTITYVVTGIPAAEYNLFTGTVVETDYVIMSADASFTYVLGNTTASNRISNGTAPTVTNNTITSPSNNIVWHFAKVGNYWTIQNAANNKYLAGTSTKNQGTLVDDGTVDLAKWTITYSDGQWVLHNYGRSIAGSDTANAFLRNNTTNGWATYAAATGNAPALFKLASHDPAIEVELTDGETSLGLGETATLVATKVNGATGTVAWSASNSNVTLGTPTVDGNTSTVVVTGNSLGSSVVTASLPGCDSVETTFEVRNGTLSHPYNIAQAKAAIEADQGVTGVYTLGTISKIDSFNANYGSITYWISDDGSTTDQLEIYGGFGLDNEHFTSIDDLQLGDVVIVYGNLQKHGQIYEYDANNYLASLTRPALVSITRIEGSLTAESGDEAWDISSLVPYGTVSTKAGEVNISAYVTLSTSDVPGTVPSTTTRNVPILVTPKDSGSAVEPKTINVSGTINTYTGPISSGRYYIMNSEKTYGLSAAACTSSSPIALDLSTSNNPMTAFDVTLVADNSYSITTTIESTVYYLACTTTSASGNNTSIRVNSTSKTATWSLDDTGVETDGAYHCYTVPGSVNRYLSCYNEQDWRGYIATTNGDTEIQFVPEGTYANVVANKILTDLVCDNGVNPPSTATWASISEAYSALKFTAEQALLALGTADEDSSNVIEQALAKYDYIVAKYGSSTYSDFLNRNPSAGAKQNISIVGDDNSAAVTAIIVVMALTVTTAGAYFFLRKKKEEK